MQKYLKSFGQLLHWSSNNTQFQETPWRTSRSLYTTLVSEIMLQQTTFATVLRHYPPFLTKFPTLASLALADDAMIKSAWIGLGYYARANNLHKACQKILEDFKGEIPLDYETLLSIPGIGPYTAKAILGIGANLPFLALDVNLERIFSRILLLEEPKKTLPDHPIAKKLLEKLSARALNESLMDLGRMVCTKRNPKCSQCPLSSVCQAYAQGENTIEAYPPPKAKIEKIPLELVRFIHIHEGRVEVVKKEKNFWLANQYEIPTFIKKTPDKKLSQYPKLEKSWEDKLKEWKKTSKYLGTIPSSITKYKIINELYLMKSPVKNQPLEVKRVGLEDPLLSSLTRKILKRLSKKLFLVNAG